MLTITPPMNPRSTALEESMLTITPPMNPRSTALEESMLTITPPMWFNLHEVCEQIIYKYIALNQDNVSEWSDMFTHELFFQSARIFKMLL
jgi:hypothetical protein